MIPSWPLLLPLTGYINVSRFYIAGGTGNGATRTIAPPHNVPVYRLSIHLNPNLSDCRGCRRYKEDAISL